MIQVPLSQIIEKIKQEKGLSEDEINQKIEQKLASLSGLISRQGAAHIVANELGVKLVQTEGRLKIKNIMNGMRSVEVAGRVLRKFDIHEFQMNQGGTGKVGSFIISDTEAEVRIVLWHENTKILTDLNPNDVVLVKKAYSRENRGKIELHTNANSKIEINPAGVDDIPKLDITAGGQGPSQQAQRKNIQDLTEQDNSVEILGTVVQVYDIKFFEVCPECRKRARQQGSEDFYCAQHGKVTPAYSYVMNLFLDDGTGNIRTVFFSNAVEKLLSKTNEELLKYTSDMPAFEDVKTDLLGKIISIQGRVTKNDMFDRLELVVNSVNPNPDPEDESKKLDKMETIKSEPKETAKDSTEPVQETQEQKQAEPEEDNGMEGIEEETI